jgi:tetratricopeptide (TPR) repeat protein
MSMLMLSTLHINTLTRCSKSQIAIRYAHSVRDASPQTFVFWVYASTRARFEEAYKDIADQLQLPGRSDSQTNVLRLVSNWLRNETNGQWLMVLDNVDDLETFFPSRERQRDRPDNDTQLSLATYLPQSRNGVILVTSRNKDAAAMLVGGYNRIKEVLAMDDGECLQLLRNKLCDPPHEESAVQLLQALDRIPLAIVQAAAYINRRAPMTVAGYLEIFHKNNKRRETLLNWDAGDLRRDGSASNSVLTTWYMSFEQIRQERPSAADLLSLMSFFNPQGIPKSTLRKSREGSACEDDEEADSDFDEDLVTLHAYSLVSTTMDNACEMHALVQFCTRAWLSSSGNAEQWQHNFVALMAQELPMVDEENWKICQQLLPHVEPLFDNEPATKETLVPWTQVLTNAARYLYATVRCTAQPIAAKALSVRASVLGPSNIYTLESAAVLARLLTDKYEYEEAEKLQQRVLQELEKKFGEHHPFTLESMGDLASTILLQDRYEEAEKLYSQIIEEKKKDLGELHHSTLISIGDLAFTLCSQGRYVEAEKLSREVLEGLDKALGEHHFQTIRAVNNLAYTLCKVHRYEEAAKLYQRIYSWLTSHFGSQHQ